MTGRTEQLDDLRRRLYREGATAEDLARYAAAAAEGPEPLVERRAEAAGAVPRASGGRRRWLGPAILLGVLLLATGGGALASRAFPGPPATRAAVVDEPAAPSAPRYFDERLEPLPAGLKAVVQRGTQSFTGRGSGTVVIDPATLSFSGGHVGLTMTTATRTRIGWQVTRIDTRQDWSFFSTVLAQRSAVQHEGVPIPAAFAYEGAPPMYVRVQAPPAVRWGLVLDFSR